MAAGKIQPPEAADEYRWKIRTAIEKAKPKQIRQNISKAEQRSLKKLMSEKNIKIFRRTKETLRTFSKLTQKSTDMDRLVYLLCAVVLLFYIVLADNSNEKTVDEYAKRKQISPLWFGPRLGRRKRNQHFDELEILLASDCDEIDEYIRSIPWSEFERCSINEDKRAKPKSKQFSPRLGRDSEEDIFPPSNGRWLQNSEIFVRSPPFAPRLGRRVLPFTPRLGRETIVSY
ncbi:hypothetical protein Trydic_g11970 [Trypoxylus dichotomus]